MNAGLNKRVIQVVKEKITGWSARLLQREVERDINSLLEKERERAK